MSDLDELARAAERAYLDAPWDDEDVWRKVANAVIAHLSAVPVEGEVESTPPLGSDYDWGMR